MWVFVVTCELIELYHKYVVHDVSTQLLVDDKDIFIFANIFHAMSSSHLSGFLYFVSMQNFAFCDLSLFNWAFMTFYQIQR